MPPSTTVSVAGATEQKVVLTSPVPSGLEWIPVPKEAVVDPLPAPMEGLGGANDPTFRNLLLPASVTIREAEVWFDGHLPPRKVGHWARCQKRNLTLDADNHPYVDWAWQDDAGPDTLWVSIATEERGRVFIQVNLQKDDIVGC